MMLKRFCKTLKNQIGIKTGDGIVVACSGGPDSVALLLALIELHDTLPLRLFVAHFDHMLRGEESKRDALFVERLSKRIKIPFYLGHGDVSGFSKGQGITIQEGARLLRYSFLRKVRKEVGAKWIATAHTADDQAEEILMRLLRGAGLGGLSGIPMRTEDGIIRPFLTVEKADILRFLKEKGQEFVEDSSNTSSKYLRNRVRHEIVPRLKALNPAFLKNVARSSDVLKQDHEVLESLSKRVYHKALLLEDEEGETFSTESLMEEHPSIRRRVYMRAIKRVSFKAIRDLGMDHLIRVDKLLFSQRPNARLDLPGGVVAQRKYGKLEFSSKRTKKDIWEGTFYLSGPGMLELPLSIGMLRLERMNLDAAPFRCSREIPRELFIDPACIRFPVVIRSRRKGERFWPLGAPRPYKLKEFFIAKKFPKELRSSIPVVLSGGQVVAVAGVEVSEPGRLKPGQKECFRLSWEPGQWIAREFSLMNKGGLTKKADKRRRIVS